MCPCQRSKAGSPQMPAANLPADQWCPAQRLLALQQTYALADDALHAWCRETGLFAHQLTQWRADFLAPPTGSANTSPDSTKAALNQLKTQHTKLQKELLRKASVPWLKLPRCWCCRESCKPCWGTRCDDLSPAAHPSHRSHHAGVYRWWV
jgi:hypothetical protein